MEGGGKEEEEEQTSAGQPHLHLHRLQHVPHWNIPFDSGEAGRIGGGAYGHV